MSFQEEMRQLQREAEYTAPIMEVSQYEIDDCAWKICDCIREQLKKQAAEGKLLYAVRRCGFLHRREERFSIRYQTQWSASVHIEQEYQTMRCEVFPYEERVISGFYINNIEVFSQVLDAVEMNLKQDDIFPVDERQEGTCQVAYRMPMQGRKYLQVVQEAKKRESAEISYCVDIAYFL